MEAERVYDELDGGGGGGEGIKLVTYNGSRLNSLEGIIGLL